MPGCCGGVAGFNGASRHVVLRLTMHSVRGSARHATIPGRSVACDAHAISLADREPSRIVGQWPARRAFKHGDVCRRPSERMKKSIKSMNWISSRLHQAFRRAIARPLAWCDCFCANVAFKINAQTIKCAGGLRGLRAPLPNALSTSERDRNAVRLRWRARSDQSCDPVSLGPSPGCAGPRPGTANIDWPEGLGAGSEGHLTCQSSCPDLPPSTFLGLPLAVQPRWIEEAVPDQRDHH
ncbi:hypothetical protein BLA17378_02916 [Burkholderia aenigmatica]|uniref:Uncharacterized protein n=1 Tax=Burkholderia aenigmatica TaxID=2015348 RepID=A0ABY6XR03_9BURK|nr:hypothetical protein BLA17378_02916 [Burkholderia aenigmatica]VWC91054.1 hypothetical protein BLA18628_01864 [Burkholderia aenigmatica]